MANIEEKFSVRERAMVIDKEKRTRKLVLKIISLLIALFAIVYVVSLMYSKFGNFTIAVNKYNYIEYGLSLSETRDFKTPTSSLDCKATEIITNIDGSSLDRLDLGAIDGKDNGDNYLCYTFYLKNAGKKTVTFEYSVVIVNMTMDIEKAVRLRLITSVNGASPEKTDYARVSSTQDENGEYLPEPNTTPFLSKYTVLRKEESGFIPDDVMKITVVIWLEGNDPECTDDIIGGQFKIDMKFNVLSGAE